MRRLKITVRPESAFISRLQSDTLFGQFCWTVKETRGDNALKALLSGYGHNPFIIFSDGFPAGYLPVPFLPPSVDGPADADIVKKRFKHRNFVKSGDLLKILPELSWRALINILKSDAAAGRSEGMCDEPVVKSADVYKNSINRITSSTATVKGSGSLYHTEETYYETDIDIYAVYNEAIIDGGGITEIFKLIGKTGFGRDKSTGKGRFSVTDTVEEPCELLSGRDEGDIFISLSNGVQADGAVLKYGKVFTKFGKHGGTLASQGKHIKNPVIMLKPGSVFSFTRRNDFYGAGLELAPNAPGHFHSAWMIPLFGRLAEDAENE